MVARDEAEKKLNRINKRYGTNHGEDYLAMLIAEQEQFRRISAYCRICRGGRKNETL